MLVTVTGLEYWKLTSLTTIYSNCDLNVQEEQDIEDYFDFIKEKYSIPEEYAIELVFNAPERITEPDHIINCRFFPVGYRFACYGSYKTKLEQTEEAARILN